MSWTDHFRSRYVRFLEQELNAERKKHAEETERLKTVHATELERAITEANRGWAEADRLRQYLIPGLPATTRTEPEDKTPHKQEEDVETGTPWMRVKRRMMNEQREMARLAEEARKAQAFPTPKAVKPAPPAEENSNAASN